MRKRWITATTAVLVAGVIAVAGLSQLQQDGTPLTSEHPSTVGPGGAAGSDVTQLTTTQVASAEEARRLLGSKALLPGVAPEGFALQDIVAVGMEGELVRDVVFTYVAGERTLTFTASRMPASFPTDLFSPVMVNGIQGYAYKQPALIELFWTAEDIHYGVVGSLTTEQAMAFAASLQ